MSRRLMALAAVAALVGAVILVRGGGNDTPVVPDAATLRPIDTFAVAESVNLDAGWSVSGGETTAAMRIGLDDLRTLTIPARTMAHAGDLVPSCSSFEVAQSCVFLADMLGEAVVWFALVPADRVRGTERLTLPGLVDMRSNGDDGVLENGWVVPLASPVTRDCGDLDTSNLREFIVRFGGDGSRSIVDLVRDEVVRVQCS